MQNNNRSFLGSIMPVTRHLLVINIIVLLATLVCEQTGAIDLNRWLGLHFWKGCEFNLIQLFTYMFMHGGFTHLFFNMFSLWMFGSLLEKVFGSKRFLFYYISCGLGAALVQELVWEFSWQSILASSVSGPAAGSVADIIKAKWMVLGYGLIELFFGVSHTMSGVAHFAHLGGMIAGIIIILYWRHNGTLTRNGLY